MYEMEIFVVLDVTKVVERGNGQGRESNPGPPAPQAHVLPLDQLDQSRIRTDKSFALREYIYTLQTFYPNPFQWSFVS